MKQFDENENTGTGMGQDVETIPQAEGENIVQMTTAPPAREKVITLKKPYVFEKQEYSEIDLSGLDKLTIQDAIDIQGQLFSAGEEASATLCETTTAFAREIAARATGLPIEFFKLAPIGLSKRVVAVVQSHITIGQPMKNRVMKLKAPYQFKGAAYQEIDLSGVADLNSMNESEAENRLAREGFIITSTKFNYLYACCIASMATGKPEDFFTGLPLAELVNLRTSVNDADFFE